MAICPDCQQEMTTAPGCTVAVYSDFKDGTTRPRIPFGSETHRPDRPDRCPDCWVRAGSFHHPGCHYEECPACNFPALSCDCAINDEEEDPALLDPTNYP